MVDHHVHVPVPRECLSTMRIYENGAVETAIAYVAPVLSWATHTLKKSCDICLLGALD